MEYESERASDYYDDDLRRTKEFNKREFCPRENV